MLAHPSCPVGAGVDGEPVRLFCSGAMLCCTLQLSLQSFVACLAHFICCRATSCYFTTWMMTGGCQEGMLFSRVLSVMRGSCLLPVCLFMPSAIYICSVHLSPVIVTDEGYLDDSNEDCLLHRNVSPVTIMGY